MHDGIEFLLGVIKVSLGLNALHLDAVNIVQDGSFYYVVDCPQVNLHALVHGQYLPVLAAVLGDPAHICATVPLLHMLL